MTPDDMQRAHDEATARTILVAALGHRATDKMVAEYADIIAAERRAAAEVQRRHIGSYLVAWGVAMAEPRVTLPCGQTVDCGGTCWLQRDHDGPCCCESDTEGPGTCPA